MRVPTLLLILTACSPSDDGKPGKNDPSTGLAGGSPAGLPTGTPGGGGTSNTPLQAAVCDLLVNPGAEDGTNGWNVDVGELISVGPSGDTPVPWSGDFQFAMGAADFSVATQTIDLTPWAPELVFDNVWAHLDAQVRDWNGNDEVWLGLTTLDASGAVIDEILEGPFTDEFWRFERVHLPVASDAVTLEVRIGGQRVNGSDNDAYVDALSLCLDTEPEPDLTDPRRGPWLNWVETNAITVLWETDAEVIGSVEVGEADGDWDRIIDETESGDHHEVRIGGLAPDTVYKYRIRFGDQVGETYSFRTSPDIAVPFRFTVWGDNQNGPDIFAEVADRMESLDPDFALAVGDVVDTGTENNWQNELLDPILDFSLDRSFLVAAGNHERYLDDDHSNFDLHLAQPGDEHCFGWTYAGAYFVFIDTEDPVDNGAQATCIAGLLASPEFAASDVQIALFHYPPRIEYWAFWTFDGIPLYDGDPEVRDVLEPQLAAAGVDLVINGHNHLYAYTAPDVYSSVSWVTTGGGGGALDTSFWVVGNWDFDETFSEHHFLHVEVDGNAIDVSAVGLDGGTLHSFQIVGD